MRRVYGRLARIGIALLIAAAALAGAGVWFVRRPWPQVSGALALGGLAAPVEVIRDRWGVSHLYAQNEHDLFLAQGYVHAQDRLWQMELGRRTGSGALSAIVGPAALDDDRFLRAVGLRRVAEQSWTALDGDARAILEAYAEGVNAYIETHRDCLPLEFVILQVNPEPWTPVDTLTLGNAMALNLGQNYALELLRWRIIARRGEQAVRQLYSQDIPGLVPDLASLRSGLHQGRTPALAGGWLEIPRSAQGSNGWVVHGSRTATAMPFLANDTHLGLPMPSTWYENGLHGGRFDSVGFALPGVPLVIIGHNRHIAWGTTSLEADVQDLYIEKLNPANPRQYEVEGHWQDLAARHDTIHVKGGEPAPLDIFFTRHGPIVAGLDNGRPVSLRWSLGESNVLFQAVTLVNLAANWDEFRHALRYWDAPAQNFVYADIQGNIGYQAAGKIPIRPPGHQGWVPAPGWSGGYEWQGFIPFDELPTAFNPPAGFIVTANDRVTPDDYAYLISHDWDPGYRARRIGDLLAAGREHTLESMQSIQGQTYALAAEALRPYLLAIEPEDDLQAQAQAQVRAWDLYLELDRAGAAIYETWYMFLARNTLEDELGHELTNAYLDGVQHVAMMADVMADPANPWFDNVNTPRLETRDDIVRRSLADAVALLSQNYGPDPRQWTWGRAHTVTFVHTPLGQAGGALERLFNSAAFPARGDDWTVNAAAFAWNWPFRVTSGVSQRMIVDLGDLDRSQAVHTTGQSGQVFHPHREDMIGLWQNVAYHPLLFTRPAVEAQAEAVLRLMP